MVAVGLSSPFVVLACRFCLFCCSLPGLLLLFSLGASRCLPGGLVASVFGLPAVCFSHYRSLAGHRSSFCPACRGLSFIILCFFCLLCTGYDVSVATCCSGVFVWRPTRCSPFFYATHVVFFFWTHFCRRAVYVRSGDVPTSWQFVVTTCYFVAVRNNYVLLRGSSQWIRVYFVAVLCIDL